MLVLLVLVLFRSTCGHVILRSPYGGEIVVFLMPSPLDLVSSHMRWIGWWEGWMHGLFDVLLQTSSGLVLDIGANVGSHSLVLGQSQQHTVWAFEPQAAPCAALRRSISANRLNNIEVLQTALGSTEGPSSLCSMRGVVLGSGAARIGKGGEHVHMTTLDSLWNARNRPHIAFVKMDVEGFEQEVLGGGRACLSARPPMVFEDWGSATGTYLKDSCGYDHIIRLRHPWFQFATRDFLAYHHENIALSRFVSLHGHEEV